MRIAALVILARSTSFLKNVAQISSTSFRKLTLSLIGISVWQFITSAAGPFGKTMGMMLVILICLPDGSVVLDDALRTQLPQHKARTIKAIRVTFVIGHLTRNKISHRWRKRAWIGMDGVS